MRKMCLGASSSMREEMMRRPIYSRVAVEIIKSQVNQQCIPHSIDQIYSMGKDGANLSVLAHLDGDEALQRYFHDQLIIYDGFSAMAAAHLIAVVLTLYEKSS